MTVVVVHTDGCCLHNGTPFAKGGYGIWFGFGNRRNHGGPLPIKCEDGSPFLHTSQRAELYAIQRALELTQHDRVNKLEIRTDSRYAIYCLTEGMERWPKNGWRNIDHKAVANQDLIMKIDNLRQHCNGEVDFVHIKGHSGDKGNEEADRLAEDGANQVYYTVDEDDEEY